MPRLYVFVAVLVAGLLAGFSSAWKVQSWRYGAMENERQAAIQRDIQKRLDRADEAAVKHEEFKAKEEVRYVDRIKVVKTYIDRPVYRNVCMDSDGLRDLNAAIRGEDAGKSQTTVPATPKP